MLRNQLSKCVKHYETVRTLLISNSSLLRDSKISKNTWSFIVSFGKLQIFEMKLFFSLSNPLAVFVQLTFTVPSAALVREEVEPKSTHRGSKISSKSVEDGVCLHK